MTDTSAPVPLVLGADTSESYSVIVPSATAQDVHDVVGRVASCTPSPQLAREVEAYAVAQVEAGAPLSLEESRITDQLQRANLSVLDHLRVRLTDAAEAARDAYYRARSATSQCLKGLPWLWHLLIVAGGLVFGAFAVRAATYVLSLPMEGVVVRPALDSGALDPSAESWRMAINMSQAFAIIAVALPIGSAISTGGRLHWFLKVLCILVDLLFSVAFAGIRSERGFTTTAIYYTAFEFVTVFGSAIYAFALGSILKVHTDRNEKRKLAEAEEAASKLEYEDKVHEARAGDEAFVKQYDIVAAREQADVRLPRIKALQAAVARREFLVAHAEISEHAVGGLVDELDDTAIRDHLTQELAELTQKEGNHVNA
ncbi:MAG: hypothetical protein WC526_00815 [Patescibacteria group bacterium]